jgi:hypothetical protein
MSRLDQEEAVIQMAAELGLGARGQPVAAIVRYCTQKIEAWLRESGGTTRTLEELQTLVCNRLRLVFEEVWSDEDLNEVIAKYVEMREIVFATLVDDLDTETFAALVERLYVTSASPDRYVAVIDCRGEKAARRFFTRWHEIAHLLTLTRQIELPFHRSTSNPDPLERLMDQVAGEIGFYGPLFDPAVRREVLESGGLTFKGAERVRSLVCPEASFHSTLNACVARSPVPVILVEAGMGYKQAERAALESRQRSFLPIQPPEAQLRVLTAMPNEAARQRGLCIHKNMRVPPESVIYRHFNDTKGLGHHEGIETLSEWLHSNGTALGVESIWVQTRRAGKHVLALIHPSIATPSRG